MTLSSKQIFSRVNQKKINNNDFHLIFNNRHHCCKKNIQIKKWSSYKYNMTNSDQPQIDKQTVGLLSS